MAVIEIEQRGTASAEQAEAVIKRMEQEGTKTREFRRITLVQIDDPSFEVTKTGTFDMKLRNNELGQLLFTVKQANAFNPTTRLESELSLDFKQLPALLTNLKLLGYIYWLGTIEDRLTYKWNGAIVDIMHHHTIDRYVIEVEVPLDGTIAEGEAAATGLLKDLGVKPLTDEELYAILHQLNMVKEYQFDLTNTAPEVVSEKMQGRLG